MTKTVIPTSAAELEELLGDQARVTALFAEGKFAETIEAYTKAVVERDAGQQVQLNEQIQAVVADYFRGNPEALEANRPALSPQQRARSTGHVYNRNAAGAQLDGKFEHTGDLLAALYGEKTGNRAAVERMGGLRNAFSSTIPSEGGFLIPEEFRSELLRIALSSSIVRPRARVIPMAVPRIKFPMVDSTSNASSVHGGIVAYWSEEGGTLAASSAKFGAVTLDAQKLTAYAEIPNELLTDSAISVGAFVDQTFPEALAWFEDVAFVRGTGVGEPLGFLHAGNTSQVSVAKETGQGAATLVWENIVKMYARMLPTSLGSAVWIANIDTFPELATMALSVGTGGGPIWLTDGTTGSPMSILGRPVIFTEKVDTLGTAGDLNFVDLSYYLIGDRQQMSAMTSEHFRFSTDTTAYRIIQRVDGRPWLKSAITPHKGTKTLSPFVKLDTRA